MEQGNVASATHDGIHITEETGNKRKKSKGRAAFDPEVLQRAKQEKLLADYRIITPTQADLDFLAGQNYSQLNFAPQPMEMTPSFAAACFGRTLVHDESINRDLNKANLDMLEHVMRRGDYHATSIIAFDVNGNLINGQHTCLACMKSGATIQVCMGWGYPTRARGAFDFGKIRDVAGQIKMTRLAPTGYNLAAKILRIMDWFFSDDQGPRYTPLEGEDRMRDWQDEVNWVIERTRGQKELREPPVCAALAVARRVYPAEVDNFVDQCRHEGDIPAESAANWLHKFWVKAAREREIAVKRAARNRGPRPRKESWKITLGRMIHVLYYHCKDGLRVDSKRLSAKTEWPTSRKHFISQVKLLKHAELSQSSEDADAAEA
jgi:hypothetical protein